MLDTVCLCLSLELEWEQPPTSPDLTCRADEPEIEQAPKRRWPCWPGWKINAADRQSVVVTVPAEGEAGSRAEDLGGENLGFLGELSAFASWQIHPHVALKGSYDVLFVTGLAIARDNISLAPAFPDLALRGQMFYHAISLGFEMVW